MWVSSCSLCPGLSEGEGQAASGETMEPEAELGHCNSAKELPTPPSPQTPPCPPGESHSHSVSLPRLPGKVRSQRSGKIQPFVLVPDSKMGKCLSRPLLVWAPGLFCREVSCYWNGGGGTDFPVWFPTLSRYSRGNTAAAKTITITRLF